MRDVSQWKQRLPDIAADALRAAVAGLCVAAAFQPVATDAILLGIFAAAAAGTLVGRAVASTPVRTPWIALGVPLISGLAAWTLSTLVGTAGFARWVGPATAVGVASSLRMATSAFVLTATLRSLSARLASFVIIEVGVLGVAFASMFASHRFGIVARPLWLSDWAWRAGVAPEVALLSMGGAAALALGAILWLETRERLHPSTLVALPAFAALLVLSLRVTGLPESDEELDLGLLDDTDSELNWTESGPEHPNAEGDDGDDGEDGQQGDDESSEAGDIGMEPLDDDAPAGTEPSQDGEAGGEPPPHPPDFRPPSGGSSGEPPPPYAVVILGDDYEPIEEAYYFRQEVWSRYNGNRLVPASSNADLDTDVARRFPTGRLTTEAPPEHPARRLVRSFVVLLRDHTAPLGIVDPFAFVSMANPDPSRFRRAYDVESMVLELPYEQRFGQRTGSPEWDAETWDHYLSAPDDERYRALAHEIIDALPEHLRDDPWAQAASIKMWADQELIYSTQHRHADARDPTSDFLFGDRTGYCVHFAHATVFLWRSLGIPARVGTGYMVPSENRRGSTIILRGSDAHAWPELYLEGIGWVVLDIHPQTILDEPIAPLEEDLADLLGAIARQEPPDPLATAEESRQRVPLGTVWRWFLRGLGAALGAALLALVGAREWRRAAHRFAAEPALARVAYRGALDRLAEVGLFRRYGETREAFARRLGDTYPSLTRLTERHVAAHLARDGRGTPADRETWNRDIRALEDEVRRQHPRLRRAAGRIHPFIPFQVR